MLKRLVSTWLYPQDPEAKEGESNNETEKKEEEVSTKEPDQNETSKKSSQEVKEEQTVNKPSSGEVRMRTNGTYVNSFNFSFIQFKLLLGIEMLKNFIHYLMNGLDTLTLQHLKSPLLSKFVLPAAI